MGFAAPVVLTCSAGAEEVTMGGSIEIEINTSESPETGPVLHRNKLDQLLERMLKLK